jgi:hypothetical protein
MPDASSKPSVLSLSWLMRSVHHLAGRSQHIDVQPSPFDLSLRALVLELETTAQFVVTSCAIANAQEAGIAVPATLAQRYFPDRPRHFPAITLGTQSLFLDRDTLASLSAFYESAALAVELSLRHVATRGSKSQPWRTTARHAIEAVTQTRLLLANSAMDGRFTEPLDLLASLDAVANGDTPGVMGDGTVCAPRLRDHRRHTRYLKSMPATLDVATTCVHVMLRDISRGGCGFDTTRRFALGTPATLVLHDQSRYEGKIAWTVGLSAGLAFDTEITETEAMFAGERRTAR